MTLYGLVGYPLSHSFSPDFFQKKFEDEHITDCEYRLFPFKDIHEFPDFVKQNRNLAGLNVTSPYKTEIIPYLNRLNSAAAAIGAVNTISVDWLDGVPFLTGYNTDYQGFAVCLSRLFATYPAQALILGSGGAAKATAYALKEGGTEVTIVSRTPGAGQIGYPQLTCELLQKVPLIINATPLGMKPHEKQSPAIPYDYLSKKTTLIDLIYNPLETIFLQEGRKRGLRTCNGLTMLQAQAEASWHIWNHSGEKGR